MPCGINGTTARSWARPDDPLRARLIQPSFDAYKGPKDRTAIKRQIGDHLLGAVAQGLIRDRGRLLSTWARCSNSRSPARARIITIMPEGYPQGIRLKESCMEKGGELKIRLSERLSQRQAEELAEVATLTEANLTQLSERLTRHVSAELSTTRDAIRQQSEQITTLLGSQQSALEQQQATVDALKRLSLTDLEKIQEGYTT